MVITSSCANLDKKYPPRRGWKVTTAHPSSELYHCGYTSDLLKPCPCCRSYPVFEETATSDHGLEERAKVFIGICPKCELRTRKEGTLKETVIQWQRRDFSKNSIAMNRRPKLDCVEAVRDLCSKVVSRAIDDAIVFVEMQLTGHQNNRNALDKLENFFRTSCFMWELDCDGLISDIRKYLYPDLPPEERIKIPLHLRDLYKGEAIKKEWIRKCTQKMNSLKQQSDADIAGSVSPSSSSKTTRKKNTQKKI